MSEMDITIGGVKYSTKGQNELNKKGLAKHIKKCAEKFPIHKKYQIIYADPPWLYKSAGQQIKGETKYPSMTLEELKEMPVKQISEPESVLLMWATSPKLPSAIELVEAWGFQYKTVFHYWRKIYKNGNPVCGIGWWTKPQIEMLLVATRGNVLKKWKQDNKMYQEVCTERLGHSAKPPIVRENIKKFFGVKKRIELFARGTCPDFGDCWGLEVPGFFSKASGKSMRENKPEKGVKNGSKKYGPPEKGKQGKKNANHDDPESSSESSDSDESENESEKEIVEDTKKHRKKRKGEDDDSVDVDCLAKKQKIVF